MWISLSEEDFIGILLYKYFACQIKYQTALVTV